VFSQFATSVELLLFEHHTDVVPYQTIRLDPETHRTFYVWHAYVVGLKAGAHYAFRVDGPHDLHNRGYRFNPNKVLIDPYGRGTTDTLWNRGDACHSGDNLATSMRSVVVDLSGYNWEGDQPINRSMNDTVIYEMHVGGFTRSPTSGVENPGKFLGVIEKIPYLKELGITAVELLPVFEFDQQEVDRVSPEDGSQLTNYWGYSPISFFNPHEEYCVSPSEGTHVNEFRDMVKALHKEGIEVILDVVFNHTGEGNHMGPTISFKGLGNPTYYHLEPWDRQYYKNYSGCGNTLNCNHPVMEKFIVECLQFWVAEMHVDGFRFDIASILSRGPDGSPMENPPVLWQIELDDDISQTKIIAEAWDAAGLYQVGAFPGFRWAEWNGKYRDDIRRFVKGDFNMIRDVASRLGGSADMYQANAELPINSVNFITAHDGFPLNDLVSYNEKHNFANGEDNNDGANDNQSWNCGVEGETDDPAIEQLRNQQVKNFIAIVMLSQGVPMLLMGDETRQTQYGNNNVYCQDNHIGWYEWDRAERHQDVFRFTSRMIKLWKENPILRREQFFSGEIERNGMPDVAWHGALLNSPGWNDPYCRVLAFTLSGRGEFRDLHVIMNMDFVDVDFEIPPVQRKKWYLTADTSRPGPDDFLDEADEVVVSGPTYRVAAHSIVILSSK